MGKVGEWFKVLADREQTALLWRIGREATRCHDALWRTWARLDPVSPLDMESLQREHQPKYKAWVDGGKKGQKPKFVLPPWKKFTTPDGLTSTTLAKALCPNLQSWVYDAIANRVAKQYLKQRFQILTGQRRIPVCGHEQIFFRNAHARIVRDPDNPNWFRLQAKMLKDEAPLLLPISTIGKSDGCMAWLNALADDPKGFTSGGCLSVKRVRGKLKWNLALTRERYDWEVDAVASPKVGRELVIWAPLDQSEFLLCEVQPVKGRPWRWNVEAHDLIQMRIAYAERRKRMQANWRQSPHSAAHGHGRRRAMAGLTKMEDRYLHRVTDWIENRTTDLVRGAIRAKCEGIRIEKLTDRDPHSLRVGDFQYFRFLTRLEQKSETAGLKFRTFASLEEARDAEELVEIGLAS